MIVLNRLYVWMAKHIMLSPFMIIIFVMSVCSCSSTKEIKTKEDITKESNFTMQKKDSVIKIVTESSRDTVKKQTNTKVKEEIIYLSPPDSTGKQHITAIIKTDFSKEEDFNGMFTAEKTEEKTSVGNTSTDMKNIAVSKTEKKENIEAISFLEKNGIKIFIALVILFMVYKYVKRL